MKRALLITFALLLAPSALGQQATPLDPAARDEILGQINMLPMSSALYFSILQSLGVQPSPPPLYSPTGTPDSPQILPDTSTSGPYQVTADSYQDSEPSITTVLVGGTRYYTTSYFRYTGSPALPRIRSSRTTDFSIFQAAQPAFPPRPPGASGDYNESFDSYIVANTGGGVGPGRTYLVGICTNNQSYPIIPPTGVYVWRSDDAGLTWPNVASVAVIPSDQYLYLDKPHIRVNTNNGHVYVTYVQYDRGNPRNTTLFVSRSTDGGVTFSTAPGVETAMVGGPQVAANTANNYIYLVWADYDSNTVRVATSTDDGLTFPKQNWHDEPARNSLVGPCGSGCTPALRSGVRAFTLPIARYNAAAHVLGVAWHEREPGNSGNPVITDAVYAYYNDAQWQPARPLLINRNVSGVDNYQPALDSDVHGNVWFVWYDTNFDPNGIRYQTFWSYNTYTGGFISGISGGGFQSDPSHNVLASIGDYQDIVSVPNGPYLGLFVHAWVGVPVSTLQDDIYLWVDSQ
jgi:hypothetical protein